MPTSEEKSEREKIMPASEGESERVRMGESERERIMPASVGESERERMMPASEGESERERIMPASEGESERERIMPARDRDLGGWSACCLLIGAVLVGKSGVAAVCLAYLAEQYRSTASVVSDSEKTYWYCVYDSDIATRYGISAVVLLLFCSVVVMVLLCGMDDSAWGNEYCHLSLYLIIGVTFIAAEACILAGTVISAHQTKDHTPFANGPPSCKTVPKGLFLAGAIISSIHLWVMSLLGRAIASPRPRRRRGRQNDDSQNTFWNCCRAYLIFSFVVPGVLLMFCSALVAAIFAMLAEAERSIVSVVSDPGKNYWYCVYDSDIATRYGILALLFLLLSLISSTVFSCILEAGPCCPIIWVTFIAAEACILAGTIISAQHTKDHTPFADGPPSCKTVPEGLFEAGSALCLVQFFLVLLGIMCAER